MESLESLQNVFSFLGYTAFTFNERNITVGQLIIVPLLIGILWYVIVKAAVRITLLMERREIEPNFVLIFRRMYYMLAFGLLLFTTLSFLNIPLIAFAFLTGALAIGVGFGAQNILNNFISGWILIWEQPIRIGDFLELEDVRGTVRSINTRSTLIRRIDGVHLLVPNSQLLENTVVNWTLVDRLVRSVVRVGVAYGSPAKKVAELMEKVANAHPSIIADPAPVVIFEDFGDNALIFDVYFWIDSFGEKDIDLRAIRSDVRFGIEEALNQHEIVIAFPQRDVHLDGNLTISRPGSGRKSGSQPLPGHEVDDDAGADDSHDAADEDKAQGRVHPGQPAHVHTEQPGDK